MPPLVNVKAWAPGDVIAGATVAATSLPQYIAYAELAGIAGHHGLQFAGPPMIAYSFLTTAPTLCVGVTSITALMAFAQLNGAEYKEAHGEEKWMDLLGAFAVLVGAASLLLAASGASRLAQRIPASVQKGWKLGFAITVVAAQMPGALFHSSGTPKKIIPLPSLHAGGAPVSGGTAAMYRLGWMLVHPQLWNFDTVFLTVLTLFLVIRCKTMLVKIFRLPGIEVIVACVVGTLVGIGATYAGDIVGKPPVGKAAASTDPFAFLTGWVRLWPWDMPWGALFERFGGVHWAITSAIAFAAVDFLAILSVVPAGPPNELAGQGVGCVISGMSGCAPIGGSLSRSMVAEMTGASSPLMGLVSGLVTLTLAFPQVGSVLAPMPKAVLAAVVLAAVLPAVVYPKDVLKFKGSDALVGWTTALASAMTDPTMGFGIGIAVHALLHGAGLGAKKTN